MGRYRQLIATIVLHGNNVSRVMPLRTPMLDGIALNQPEWQILEYLLEYEQEELCMCRISERLGIPQSSLSKAVKQLCRLGLVERYRRGQNRKNVILHVTPLGHELYREHIPSLRDGYFAGFFKALEGLDAASLAAFTEALGELTQCLSKDSDTPVLVPMDPPEQR